MVLTAGPGDNHSDCGPDRSMARGGLLLLHAQGKDAIQLDELRVERGFPDSRESSLSQAPPISFTACRVLAHAARSSASCGPRAVVL